MRAGRAAALAFVLAALLAGNLLPSGRAQGVGGPQTLTWWGETGPLEGFHIRVPVTVTNPHDYPLTNGPVAAEVDVGAGLVEAGWVSSPLGARDVLRSFSLDEASVRVVAMTDFADPAPGTDHGQLQTVDGDLAGAKRSEVPSTFFPGSLTRHSSLGYDPVANPFITVVWRVEGTLAPCTAQACPSRTFYVYLDTRTNGAHAPSLGNGTVLAASLADLFWSGPGLTLYGQVSPSGSQAATVSVTALQPGTRVTVEVAQPSGAFVAVVPPSGMPSNPATLPALGRTDLYVSTGATALFRVRADKPVLATVASSGFVPSADGGLVGRDFDFALTHPASFEQDTVYVLSSSDKPTHVDVQPVPNPSGLHYRFEVNTLGNGFNATMGPRAGGFSAADGQDPSVPTSGCQPAPDPTNAELGALLPRGPGLYHAHVEDGDPVMLELQPSDGLFQVPARDGTPTGRWFQAASSWSDRTNHHTITVNYCETNDRLGHYFAVGVGGSADVSVMSPGRSPEQVDPPDPNQARTVAPAPADASSGPFSAYGSPPVLDRALLFHASDPVWLFAGLTPEQIAGYDASAPHGAVYGPPGVVNGPLLGDGVARRFAGLGPTTFVAPFDDTPLDVRLRCQASSGGTRTTVVQRHEDLAAGGIASTAHCSGTDRPVGFTVDAGKPLVVLPSQGPSAMLAGIPAFLASQVGAAQYRGFLIRLASPSGLDPVAGTVVAGSAINYPIQVTNLGRNADGSILGDAVRLELVQVTPGWQAQLDVPAQVSLPDGEPHALVLTVTPGPGVVSGSFGVASLRATSLGNPMMQSTVQTRTLLKDQHGVRLAFDSPGGLSYKRLPAFPGAGGVATANFTVWVKNLGSTEDTFDLTVDPTQDVLRLPGTHQEVDAVHLMAKGQPGDAVQLDLNVTLASSEAGRNTGIEARSQASPAAAASATATSLRQQPSDLRLTAQRSFALARPGEAVPFLLHLANLKDSAADVRLSVRGDAPGWPEPYLRSVDSVTHQAEEGNLTQESVAGSVDLMAFLRVPGNATAGDRAAVRVAAQGSDSPFAREAFLLVEVLPVHDLRAEPPSLPIETAALGAPDDLEVRVDNQGNLDEFLAPQVADLPAGWTLGLPHDVALPRGATQTLHLNLTVPTDAAPGLYNLSFDLVAEDGNRTTVALPTSIGGSGLGNATDPKHLAAQPGQTVRAIIPIGNPGNTRLTVAAKAAPGEAWSLQAPAKPRLLPPGASAALELSWAVPRGAFEGNSTHHAILVFTPIDAASAPREQTVSAVIDVGRSDLAIASARTFPGAAGTLVQALVTNQGNRPAGPVRIELRSGDVVVDNVTLDRVAPHAAGNVTLRAPPGSGAILEVVVDPGDLVVERNEGNNRVQVEAATARSTPLPTFLVIAPLLAAALRRRWP